MDSTDLQPEDYLKKKDILEDTEESEQLPVMEHITIGEPIVKLYEVVS